MNVVAPANASSSLVDEAASSFTYSRISQKNPEYDLELWKEIDDFYKGGYAIQRNAARYLRQLSNEHATRYEERCATAGYQPYFGQIVDQFTSDLFGQPLSVTAASDADNPNTPGEVPDKVFYPAFERDCDRRGNPFVVLMNDCLTTALKKRYALVQVDAPAPEKGAPTPQTKAEEEAQGATQLYAYEVPIEQLIDWKLDDRGGFVWAILNKREIERASPRDSRNVINETFTIWTMAEDGTAFWERYRITYPAEKPPTPETVLLREDFGTTTFVTIPLHRLELPDGLWVGNKIGPMAREHYQRRSTLITSENRSLVCVPVIQLGSPIGAPGSAIPAEIQQDDDRGNDPISKFERKGFLVLGADDKYGYLQPDPGVYKLTEEQLEHLRENMFQVNHQMAASVRPSAGMMGRSGLSKQKDGESTAKVLRALGRLVRQFALKIFDTIAKGRKEKVVWTAHGLDAYETTDRAEVIDEALSLEQITIPSPTFKRLYAFQTAKKLVSSADPQSLATIQDEINKGITAEESMRIEADVAEHQTKIATLGATQKAAKDPNFGKPAPKAARPFA